MIAVCGSGALSTMPSECAATRERHVCLSVGEGTLHVNNGVVERQALTLVNGDSPCCLHGELRECALLPPRLSRWSSR